MRQKLIFDTAHLKGFISDKDLEGIYPELEKAHRLLTERKGPGKEFLGWLDLPAVTDDKLIGDIEETAEKLNSLSDVIIVIGIGGSYLGAKAAIEMLAENKAGKKIIFAGNNLCAGSLKRVLSEIKDKEASVNVISKSGTTTEPAIAFRIVEDFLRKKYGSEGLKERIVCTTDKEKGALKKIAGKKGYKTFVIPDDIGGRFSVLTPVGLLPASLAGINIRELTGGANFQRENSLAFDPDKNISCAYAARRNILYRKGRKIEILSDFDPDLHYLAEWWKQLFGESEGKDGRGIFPSSCDFSTDLHSIGQLVQSGERNIFETFLVAEKPDTGCKVPHEADNMDDLNYLAGKELDYINIKAYEAAALAHFEGGVPNSTVRFGEKSAFCLGQLFYFFEMAAALSGYISLVNPFDQPGVESYKKNMFRLLGRLGA